MSALLDWTLHTFPIFKPGCPFFERLLISDFDGSRTEAQEELFKDSALIDDKKNVGKRIAILFHLLMGTSALGDANAWAEPSYLSSYRYIRQPCVDTWAMTRSSTTGGSPIAAKIVVPPSAVQPGKPLSQQAIEHWKSEFGPFLSMLQGSETPIELNNRLLKKLPLDVQNALAKSARCLYGVECLLEQGVKVAYAPAYLVADVAEANLKMLGAAGNALRHPSRDAVKQIAVLPVELVYKNAPYVVGYTALTAVGWNIPTLLEDKNSTYLYELDQAIPPGEPFKKDELMVVVVGTGVSEFHSADYFVQQRKKHSNLKDEQVVKMEASSPEDFGEKLASLKGKGKIKELVIVAHGLKGEFSFNSSGIEDLFHPTMWFDQSGTFNQKKLDKVRSQLTAETKNLFAPGARINLVSCRVAKGKTGTEFVKSMGGVLLQHGGTIVASPRSVYIDAYKKRDEDRKIGNFDANDPVNSSVYNLIVYPIHFLMEGLKLGIFWNAVTGNYSQDVTRVIPIAGSQDSEPDK